MKDKEAGMKLWEAAAENQVIPKKPLPQKRNLLPKNKK